MAAFTWEKVFRLDPKVPLPRSFPKAKPVRYDDELLALGPGCWGFSLAACRDGGVRFPATHVILWASNPTWAEAIYGKALPRKKREYDPPHAWVGVPQDRFTSKAILEALASKRIYPSLSASYRWPDGKFKFRIYESRQVQLFLPSRDMEKDEPPGAILWKLEKKGGFEGLRRLAERGSRKAARP